MADNKGTLININEPNESRARREGELFPGEIDNLKDLVATWLKWQPSTKKETGKVVKLPKDSK